MTFRLIESSWHNVIREAAKADTSALRIVCPFIKQAAARTLIEAAKPKRIQVITRFNQSDFYACVSDTGALRVLLDHGASIRGVRNLHAKLFLFGDSSALVTSANLTQAAMRTNHELGFFSDDPKVVRECRSYFDRLWQKAGGDVESLQLDRWDAKLAAAWASASGIPMPTGLRDEGAEAGLPSVDIALPERAADAPQAWVKLFGDRNERLLRTDDIFEEVKLAGSHWACAYPKNKRPKSVVDGAVMFIARLVEGPGDIIVYGRAIGLPYRPGRDDATEEDIAKRPWKATWPRYIRVHSPELLAGTLAGGVPLSSLMDALGANAFAATKANAEKGRGNTNPRHAYRQQPAIRLTPEGTAWLNGALQSAFTRHGQLPQAQLDLLDWPKVPEVDDE